MVTKYHTIILASALLFLCSHASAKDEWTRGDTYIEAGYLTLHVLDWGTARAAAHNGTRELNPLLGERPHMATLNNYFILTGIGHVAVAYALPSTFRHAFQAGTIAMEAIVVRHNYSVGFHVYF